jgi:hypothetical protein
MLKNYYIGLILSRDINNLITATLYENECL